MDGRNELPRAARGWRYGVVFAALLAALLVAAVLNIATGTMSIPPDRILHALFLSPKNILRALAGEAIDYGEIDVVWQIRLPRALMAAMLGGALALSGFLLQTFFANPIAGPFVLGISSGAKMAVALVMVFALRGAGAASSGALVATAFAGSLLAVSFILLLARRLKHAATLLVAGIMIGYICSAATEFIITFADDADIVNLHSWSQGSFSGMSWPDVGAAALVAGAASIGAFMLSKPMGAYQMGEVYARSVGVNIRAFRAALILLASALAAAVTAFAGPVSFVGIAVPYLVKRALNTSKPLVVVPASLLGGALFCLACDWIARTAFAPRELNISTVTSVFGAPVVIAMMLRRRERP